MNAFKCVNGGLNRVSQMWIAFATILLVIALGLGLLSRHALRLQHRERIQQNLRVALWRLDSRLAPMIATIHQQRMGDPAVDAGGQFILERFTLIPDPGNPVHAFRYRTDQTVDTVPPAEEIAEGETDRVQQLPIESLLLAINDLALVWTMLSPTAAPPVNPDPTGRPQRSVSRDASAKPTARSIQSRSIQSKSQTYEPRIVDRDNSPRKGGPAQRAAIVQQQVEFNSLASPNLPTAPFLPRMLSVWIDDQLAVVRTRPDGQRGLEGVWMDWPRLHQSLVEDIADLLPAATIRPAGEDEPVDPESALAALPALLVPGAAEVLPNAWTPTHTALLLSWAALAISALVAAIALGRIVALSERRASFVSAVTHELRTPLTTFRLYSDLLARDLVTDPADRLTYLATLRSEADRLIHLVENVLRYSRLERTHQPAEPESIVISQWIERVEPRLRHRLDDAGMSLEIEQKGDGLWRTDPPAMEQVLFNLVDNAAKYAATAADKVVRLEIDVTDREVSFRVSDHGEGVPQSLRKSMFRPFSKSVQRAAETAAGVGLGLALVKRTVTSLGGTIDYVETATGGASFNVCLPRR